MGKDRLRFVLATFLVSLAVASPATAATISVNTTADETTPSDGLCSLREAVFTADFNASGTDCTQGDPATEDTIQLEAETYGLDSPHGSLHFSNPADTGGVRFAGAGMSATTIHANAGLNATLIDTQAAGPLTLEDLTLDAGGSDTSVAGGVETITNSLTINRVAITNTTGEFGGGVYFQPDTTAHPNAALTITDSLIDHNTATSSVFTQAGGAGVSTQGPTTITRTAITNNTTHFAAMNTDGFGGGVNASGALTLIDDLIAGNSVDVTRNGTGGGVRATSGLTAVNVTFTGNTVTAPNSSVGGAMFLSSAALTDVTIAGNSATISPAIAGSANLLNSIVDDGVAACGSALSTLGGNIDRGSSCWSSNASGDLQGTDPLLGALADNGGPTETMALLTGSPAIDRVPTSACVDQQVSPQPVTADQRGVSRPQGSACDSGAFELEQATPPPGGGGQPAASGPTGQRAAALRKCKKKKSKKARKRCRKRAKRLPV